MARRFRVLVQEEVIDEVEEIYSFIAQNHPGNAKKLTAELKSKIRSLKTFPERGTLCPEWQPDDRTPTRFVTHKGYSIIYCIVESEVRIVHVLGPGLNWRYAI